MIIRPAEPEDASFLVEIYAYYVENTAITFESCVPSTAEFAERIRHTLVRYPYLVAETENGEILGYAYAGPMHPRDCYQWSAELSIYLKKNSEKKGIGRQLYSGLEEILKEMGICNLYACIASPKEDDEYLTHNSVDYHAHLGFRLIGTFENCANKFGRWYNMVWMEKQIAEHPGNPDPVRWYRGSCTSQ